MRDETNRRRSWDLKSEAGVNRSSAKRRHGRGLRMESLENRWVLSAATVTLPQAAPNDNLWTYLDEIPESPIDAPSYLRPEHFVSFSIDHSALRGALSAAPMEFTSADSLTPFTFSIPSPDGSLDSFEIVETMVMHPDLAAKFPDIKTYRGQGIDHPSDTIRLDVTPLGFHAQVLSTDGSYYIDPYYHLDQSVYVSYAREGLQLDPETTRLRQEMREQLEVDDDHVAEEDEGDIRDGGAAGNPLERSGTQLRTYRLANAATGEYTARFGGTVAGGQAAIVTAINRVSGVYEVELSIRLQLVANNDTLVYTNSATDPYTNNDGVTMLTQNQNNITAVIGSANYDIGHVFSTGGGGVAGLGVLGVSGSKARGVTGLANPVGDAFYIDYVAHEMGHQFGGNHTFNGSAGSCSGNRNSSTAYEPGSGSTIMGYAGICGSDDLQAHSDAIFHSVSFDEIIRLVDITRPTVGTRTATGNNVPTANAGADYFVPAQTPFRLTGSGTDADAGDVLTYNWEERDLGPAQAVLAADNGSSPLFRTWNSTTTPTRYFPRLPSIISGTLVRGEKYALTTRNMNFRLTVRDNRSGGGGVNTDDMIVRMVNTGAAFAVTSPNTNIAWNAGSTQTVTWNVAGTDGGSILTSQVNILLSTDGGNTYPTVLASNVANDGSQEIVVPNSATTTARIMVEAVGNIYFDISNVNFSITADTNPPVAFGSAPDIHSGGGTTQDITVIYVDNNAVDVSDIDGSDIQVIAPGATVFSASVFSVSSATDTTPVTVVYRMSAPGGTWDLADNGTYTIRAVGGEVTDTNDNPIAAGDLGTFLVDIAGTQPGDFDANGALDCADANALTQAIAAGANDPLYDVTGDTLVNSADLNEWVLNLKGTLFGDANLDFNVDGSDFNIWNANKFLSNTGWCTGDFNADAATDGSDFNVWNSNKFQSALRGQPIPPPAAVRVAAVERTRLTPVVVDAALETSVRGATGAPRIKEGSSKSPLVIAAHEDRHGSGIGRELRKAKTGAVRAKAHELVFQELG